VSDIKNAVIENTFLGIEDHGIFTFSLMLDYGGSGQGAGMYCLGGEAAIPLIKRILEICDTNQWEHIEGKMIRADADQGKVHRIGHILKDDWLDFESFFAGYKE